MFTVTVAEAGVPTRPLSAADREAVTVNPAVPTKLFAGVNFRPAAPCARVTNPPDATGVVPSCRNTDPLETPVTLNAVTPDGPVRTRRDDQARGRLARSRWWRPG